MDVFENAKRTMDELKEGIKDKIDATKLELAYSKKKKSFEQEKMEEEQNAKEQAIFQEEYERLSGLDEKQLMVEMVFAIRGFYSEVETLKNNQKDMVKRMASLELDMDRLQKELEVLKDKKETK